MASLSASASVSPPHLVPRAEIWWVGPIPADRSVCTTTIREVSDACCQQFNGRGEYENRASSHLSDSRVYTQINCLSRASPDDWERCARQVFKDGTGQGSEQADAQRFSTWCNTDAKILRSVNDPNRGQNAAPPRLANAGTLAAIAAAALGILAAY